MAVLREEIFHHTSRSMHLDLLHYARTDRRQIFAKIMEKELLPIGETQIETSIPYLKTYSMDLEADTIEEINHNFLELFCIVRSLHQEDQLNQFMTEHVEGPGSRGEGVFSTRNIRSINRVITPLSLKAMIMLMKTILYPALVL